jgi:hypothetical protein
MPVSRAATASLVAGGEGGGSGSRVSTCRKKFGSVDELEEHVEKHHQRELWGE